MRKLAETRVLAQALALGMMARKLAEMQALTLMQAQALAQAQVRKLAEIQALTLMQAQALALTQARKLVKVLAPVLALMQAQALALTQARKLVKVLVQVPGMMRLGSMVGSFCLRIVLAAACIFLIAACVSPSANGASGAAEPVSDVAAVFGSTSADATAAAVPDAVSIDAAAATAAATAPAAAAIVPDAVSTDSTSADATAATTAPAAVAIVPGTISIAVEQTDSADQQYIQRVYSETVHYNEEIYAIARTKGAAYEAVRDVRAGVVPHHALASRLIASFFETASSQSFDTIVILGPNHFAKIAAIVTTGADWYTPFGALRNDDELTELLLSSDILHAVRDDGIVENDHAASYLIPFVADYFPAAQVTAALLSPQMSVGQIGELARLLSEYRKGKHILLIGSIDFSHYLLPSQAKANDEATKYTVRENNVDDLYRMSDGFLDSPSTLLTVLRYVELIGGSGLALLDQSSSYEELGLPPECVSPGDGVTTYLIYGDY